MGELIVKDIKGDVNDISQLFKNTGVNLDDYLLDNNNKRVNIPAWLIWGDLMLLFCSCCIVYIEIFNGKILQVIQLLSFLLLVILVFCIHCKYNRIGTTVIAIIGGIILMLISFKVLSPQEAIQTARDTTIECLQR